MKCDNCGNEIKNMLVCPLCGYRQGKINRCSVCTTIVHYGQSNCPNCGNPTKYLKKEDINKKYYLKDDLDYSKHTATTHVYQSQEMYDYQESDNDIKKRFEEARDKLTRNHKKTVKRDREKKNLIAIVLGIIFLWGALFNLFVSDEANVEMVDIKEMSINGDNNDLMMAGNFQQGSVVFLDNDELYLGCDYDLKKADRSFEKIENIDFISDSLSGNIYIEDNYIYYDNFGIYKRYDINSGNFEELFYDENILPIKNHRFLYTNEMKLYLYENGESRLIDSHDIYYLAFDFKTELIYFEVDGAIRAIDLEGRFKNEYDLYAIGNFYVDDGVIYYSNINGIEAYDTKIDDSISYLDESDIYNFIVTNNGIVYTDMENDLYYHNFDDEEIYLIDSDIYEFNVAGDKIIYRSNDDEYNWYISDGYSMSKLFE